MEVEKWKSPQPWTYREVDDTLEKDDGVEQSGAPPPVLMVLTSDKAWPYSWEEDGSTRVCHVNCEVERVWQIVKFDLTGWLSTLELSINSLSVRRVLIWTPGIGKSVTAGSYLLYQLLHCDAERLPAVACFICN
ncbi:retrotransposon hot spot (RHS) protein [Trypanosoma cruzi]|nr:retrotransposon hot spot (RHS) protein [Trypanosoma cruzi]